MSQDDPFLKDPSRDSVPPPPPGAAPYVPPTQAEFTPQPAPSAPYDPQQQTAYVPAPPPAPEALLSAGAPAPTAYAPLPLGAPNTSKNWMGLTAMILAIVTIGLPAIILGALGLQAVKRGEATNRGQALAGVIIPFVWFAIGLGLALFTMQMSPKTIELNAVAPGDCFTSSLVTTDEIQEGYYSFEPCTDESNGIVYYVGTVTEDIPYDDPSMADVLWNACTTEESLVSLDTDIAYDYYIEYYIGTAAQWNGGNHKVVCGASTAGELDYGVFYGEPNMAS